MLRQAHSRVDGPYRHFKEKIGVRAVVGSFGVSFEHNRGRIYYDAGPSESTKVHRDHQECFARRGNAACRRCREASRSIDLGDPVYVLQNWVAR